MIYRVLYRDGSEVYLYLLLEFQSAPDPWMALRVVVYTSLLLQHLVRENRLTPQGKLPPVFPLVLYNGDARWNAPHALSELIALPPTTPLWSYQPGIRYYLVDESRYPTGKPGSLVGILFEIENCQRLDELQPLIAIVAGQWKTLIPPSLRRALISWIARVIAPGKGIDPQQLDTENLAEVQIMLATRVKQWEQEILKKGIEKGIEEGIEKGIEKGIKKGIEQGIEAGIEKGMLSGEAVMLRRLLHLRFGELPQWVDTRFGHATHADLERWSQRVLDARTLSEVFD